MTDSEVSLQTLINQDHQRVSLLSATRRGEPWTQKEDDIIMSGLTSYEAALVIHRTFDGVCNRREYLNECERTSTRPNYTPSNRVAYRDRQTLCPVEATCTECWCSPHAGNCSQA